MLADGDLEVAVVPPDPVLVDDGMVADPVDGHEHRQGEAGADGQDAGLRTALRELLAEEEDDEERQRRQQRDEPGLLGDAGFGGMGDGFGGGEKHLSPS